MDRKILLFISLSALIVLFGLPLTLKQNWAQFSNMDLRLKPANGKVKNAIMFIENGNISFQEMIADSVRVLFRFPPHTCSCLEADFTDALNRVKEDVEGLRIIAIIEAEDTKDLFFFRERTGLTCPVYATADTLIAGYDTRRSPYACVVYPDMTAKSIIPVHTATISELISYVQKNIR